uniref:(northern house mosquito) hypothetical protein n=1 Tax=Culex pipiens TaxID=7175 RepID=A0A8D8HKE7_CULPI
MKLWRSWSWKRKPGTKRNPTQTRKRSTNQKRPKKLTQRKMTRLQRFRRTRSSGNRGCWRFTRPRSLHASWLTCTTPACTSTIPRWRTLLGQTVTSCATTCLSLRLLC